MARRWLREGEEMLPTAIQAVVMCKLADLRLLNENGYTLLIELSERIGVSKARQLRPRVLCIALRHLLPRRRKYGGTEGSSAEVERLVDLPIVAVVLCKLARADALNELGYDTLIVLAEQLGIPNPDESTPGKVCRDLAAMLASTEIASVLSEAELVELHGLAGPAAPVELLSAAQIRSGAHRALDVCSAVQSGTATARQLDELKTWAFRLGLDVEGRGPEQLCQLVLDALAGQVWRTERPYKV